MAKASCAWARYVLKIPSSLIRPAMQIRADVVNLQVRPPERWQSGRMRRFAKPLYGLTPVPRVRIPPSPPRSLDCREGPLASRGNTRIMPVFRDNCRTNGTAENGLLISDGATVTAFLWRTYSQSGFTE